MQHGSKNKGGEENPRRVREEGGGLKEGREKGRRIQMKGGDDRDNGKRRWCAPNERPDVWFWMGKSMSLCCSRARRIDT